MSHGLVRPGRATGAYMHNMVTKTTDFSASAVVALFGRVVVAVIVKDDLVI